MKRVRSGSVVVSGSKRSIEKKIVNFNKAYTTTQAATLVYQCPQATAVTWTGGHINLGYRGTNTGSEWTGVLVHVRDGQAFSTISTSDASNLYTPEQDVLWVGRYVSGPSDDTWCVSEKIKTKRKMKGGDGIYLIGVDAVSSDVVGSVTSFVKI